MLRLVTTEDDSDFVSRGGRSPNGNPWWLSSVSETFHGHEESTNGSRVSVGIFWWMDRQP